MTLLCRSRKQLISCLRQCVWVVVVIVALSVAASAKCEDVQLDSSDMPNYPEIARVAHLSGTVSLHFDIDGRGQVSHVVMDDGNPFLGRFAMGLVQGWRFVTKRNTDKYTCSTVFHYVLSSKEVDDSPVLRVTLHTFRDVEIYSDPARRSHN